MNERLPLRSLRWLVVVLIVLWSVAPIVLGVVTSVSSQIDVQAVPTRWVPHHVSLNAYRALLEGTSTQHAGGTVTEAGVYSQALKNSTEMALATTALTLVVATMAAYAFGRLRFRLGRALFTAVLSTMVVPIFVVVVALFKLMAQLQLIDTKRGLVLVFVATLSPLATWLLYNHVREMETEPEEAALIDGCNRWQAFIRVVVPQMGSAIAAVAAILVLSVWGEFLIPLVLSSTTNAKPVTVLITEYVGKYTTNYPILAAAGVLALLPPALIALILNRRITGVVAGSS
ncbi:MAG: carbohydrate ABC transporter permease [Gaiellales bacterium]